MKMLHNRVYFAEGTGKNAAGGGPRPTAGNAAPHVEKQGEPGSTAEGFPAGRPEPKARPPAVCPEPEQKK